MTIAAIRHSTPCVVSGDKIILEIARDGTASICGMCIDTAISILGKRAEFFEKQGEQAEAQKIRLEIKKILRLIRDLCEH